MCIGLTGGSKDKQPRSSQRRQGQLWRYTLKYRKFYLKLEQNKPWGTGCPVRLWRLHPQTWLDCSSWPCLGGWDWVARLEMFTGAFRPQTPHHFKVRAVNTTAFLLWQDLCKSFLALLSRFQYFQNRGVGGRKESLLNNCRKPHWPFTSTARKDDHFQKYPYQYFTILQVSYKSTLALC